MKLTTFLLFIALIQVSAKGFSQITLKETNAPLSAVLKTVEKQSGYLFVYNAEQVQLGFITADLKNANIDDALKVFFKDKKITYQIIDKNIVLLPKKEDISLIDNLKNKIKEVLVQNTVNGKVTDDKNLPLVGVTVTIKETGKGTLTDEKGYYTIAKAGNRLTLVFTYIGFKRQEVLINSQDEVNIQMTPELLGLDAVQVIAYGKTSQRLNTGDVTSVKAKDIENQPVTSVLAAIQGRVPGLLITEDSGYPDGGFNVRIRGQSSLNSGSVPLFVIDGMPYSPPGNFVLGGFNNATDGTPLNFINIKDIESVDVLKDADATAIYGSRGANGVILITTKKGSVGPTQLDASVDHGMSYRSTNLPYLNTQQYIEVRNEALKNDGLTPGPNDYDLNGTWDKNRYTNWQKVLIGNTASTTNARLALSGGNLNMQYLVSGDYHYQSLTLPGDFYGQKAAIHFNINTISNNQRLKMSLTGSYWVDNSLVPNIDITSSITNLAPNSPSLYNADGTINWANSTFFNPLGSLLATSKNKLNNLQANFSLSYHLIEGLEFKTDLAYGNIASNNNQKIPSASTLPAYDATNQAGFFYQNSNTLNIQPQLSFQKFLGRGKLTALAGMQLLKSVDNTLAVAGINYPTDAQLGSTAGAQTTFGTTSDDQFNYGSMFARVNYNLEDKYILNASFSRDGSSRFGPGRQFANFGAFGAAWIFSKEKLIENNFKFLSFGKLRASYGVTGNDQIGDYHYLALYNTTQTQYQNATGVFPNSLSNPDLSWEIIKKMEMGLDLGFFHDRILLTASIYEHHSSHQLTGLPLPSFIGPGGVLQNSPILINNKGVELSLTSKNFIDGDFKWTTNLNLSRNWNIFVSYPNFSESGYADSYVLGKSLDIRKVFRSAGVNQQTGVYQFYDANGHLTYNPSFTTDRTSLVDRAPGINGGIQNEFSFKGFQLSFFLQYLKQKGGDSNLEYGVPVGIFGYNWFTSSLNRWQKPGDNSHYEKYSSSYGSDATNAFNYVTSSNMYFIDMSYIRLNNLVVSYNFPKKLVQSIHINNLQVFSEGQNLLTLRVNNSSNIMITPPMKIITFGVHVTL